MFNFNSIAIKNAFIGRKNELQASENIKNTLCCHVNRDALPLSALSVRSVTLISASPFYPAGGQTRDVDPMLG